MLLAWGRTAKTPCVQRILASGASSLPGVRNLSVREPGPSGPAPSGVRGPATSARSRPAPSWLQIERRECAAAAVRAGALRGRGAWSRAARRTRQQAGWSTTGKLALWNSPHLPRCPSCLLIPWRCGSELAARSATSWAWRWSGWRAAALATWYSQALAALQTEDSWVPTSPDTGLDPLTVRSHVPAVWVLLSRDPLDPNEYGYQPPGAPPDLGPTPASSCGPQPRRRARDTRF
uniref:Uncharacterized protein n=1 Tax=Capra hircus TaxID=9925 RepID=A0A8C2P1X7_CAPHI